MIIDYTIVFIIAVIVVFFGLHIMNTGEASFISGVAHEVAIISSIFIPIGIYVTYQLLNRQLLKMSADTTFAVIDRSWLNINKIFLEYHDACPTFINSLYFDWQKKILGEVKTVKTKDKWCAVNYLSYAIFQAWEDIITGSQFDVTDKIAWINGFLAWANSRLLYNNWQVLKFGQSKTTQLFGDYLFYMARNNKITNTHELNKVGLKIVNSDLFKRILIEKI
jgi:hypothetical protein